MKLYPSNPNFSGPVIIKKVGFRELTMTQKGESKIILNYSTIGIINSGSIRADFQISD
jgi:hypothetical protein